jgi:hypothetical protein
MPVMLIENKHVNEGEPAAETEPAVAPVNLDLADGL